MTILACVIAVLTSRYLLLNPEHYFSESRHIYEDHPLILLSHVGGGTVALLVGPWQFVESFRYQHLQLHRILGCIYLAATVGFAGASGLFLALYSYAGVVTHTGFLVLAALWMLTGVMALWHICHGHVAAHRDWMVRSYALTFAAVTLRIWLPLLAICGVSFEQSYQTVAWLAWVPNLLFAEYVLLAAGRPNSETLIR